MTAYIRTVMLLLVCTSLYSALADLDTVLLKNEQRIYGNILQQTPLVVVIKDRNGDIQKLPARVVDKCRYADGSDWMWIRDNLSRNQWTSVALTLGKDIQRHPGGGSFLQIKTMVNCLQQLKRREEALALCHRVCRMERNDILQVLDLYCVPELTIEKEIHFQNWIKIIEQGMDNNYAMIESTDKKKTKNGDKSTWLKVLPQSTSVIKIT